MTTPYNIDEDDLDRFLDDVNENISRDDQADFKKLVLYLFGFSHYVLGRLHGQPHNNRIFSQAERLLATVELVLSKKKHLVNSEVTPQEIQLVVPTAPPAQQLTQLYQWTLSFAIQWLEKFSTNLDASNLVKSFLLELLNIFAVNQHSFKFKKSLRSYLLQSLELNLTSLLTQFSQYAPKGNLSILDFALLSTTTHIFTVVNDFEVATRLLLKTTEHQQRIGVCTKKLGFILSFKSYVNLPDSLQQMVYNCRSVFLLNLTSNILLDANIKWDAIFFVVNWIQEYCQMYRLDLIRPSVISESHDRVVSACLMKIFIFCRKRNLITNFFNSFNLDLFNLQNLSSECVRQYPPLIVNILHLLAFKFYKNSEKSRAFPSAAVPFMDPELDYLRSLVLESEPPSVYSSIDFLTQDSTFLSAVSSPKINQPIIKPWLEYVLKLIQKSNNTLEDSPSLEKFESFTLLTALRHVPCIIAGDYDFDHHYCYKCITMSRKNHLAHISPTRKLISELNEAVILYKRVICDHFLSASKVDLTKDSLLTCNILLALFNLFATFRLLAKELINNEPCFEFVLNLATQSRNRDVRILSARILPLYLINEMDRDLDLVFKRICSTVSSIDILIPSNVYMAESTLLALANLAIVSEGEWLCVCLVKLIDCLGEANEQHVNLAYNSLLYVASAKALTPYKLLSPFLPSIAERIIKRDRMINKLTELLCVTKKFLLNQTKNYTAPRLLEYYKRDYVQEIADASNISKLQLVTKTLPRIMAMYLCKDELIDAKYIVNVLSNTSPSYQKVTTSDLIPNIGELLWHILLQLQIDDDGVILNEQRIFGAIIYISKINWLRRSEHNENTIPPDEKDFDYIRDILKDHVLELVQRFSEDVHQMKGIKPFLEKVSAIKAVLFIIQKNTEAASWALGQISTCLQSAMNNPALEFEALKCWNVLVQNLQSRNLVSLFDITISLMFQRFQLFSRKAKFVAAEILKIVFNEISINYQKYGPYYYSYPFVRDLDKFFILDTTSDTMQKLRNSSSLLSELSRRLQTNNKVIVHQALDDLINSTWAHQQVWQSENLREESNEKEISRLVRTVLDISVHFRSRDPTISTKCAKALSSFGALDPNKFEFKTVKNQIIVLFDFHDYRENSKFLVDFIGNKIIRNFWASHDPVRQLFSVYSMQCFLSVLELDASILEPPSQGIRTEVWNNFSEMDKSTLTPLLSSKYFAQLPKYEPLVYPYYRVGMRYEKWLVDITTNLLRLPFPRDSSTTKGSAWKEMIFQTCSMLIRDQEISIAQHLLKYILLSHVVNGNTEVTKSILKEFLEILNIDTKHIVGSERVENLKLCYQSIFEVIDYFNEWVSSATQKLSDAVLQRTEISLLKKCRQHVMKFLEGIPTELIASTSSICDSYERTIMYLEKCHREGHTIKGQSNEQLDIAGTLQSVYSNIDDFDSLDGVLKTFTTANLSEKLSTFQYNENWSIAQESFQVLSSNGDMTDQKLYLTKLLESYSDHALYDKALLTLDSRLGHTFYSDLPIGWVEVGLQEALVSGNIELIKKWLYIAGVIALPQDVRGIVKNKYAHGALQVAKGRYDEFIQTTEEAYSVIGQSLALSISSSFSKNTMLMRQLHIMFDTSSIVDLINPVGSSRAYANLAEILNERLQNTDLEFSTQWQILSMQKLFNSIADRQSLVSDLYIKLAQAARKDRRLDIATKCIMNAMILNDQDASTEYAYLLWDQGKRADAIQTLADNLKYGDVRKMAEKQLQLAIWLDESSHSSSTTIVNEYTRAYKIDKDWDKPYFELGKYYSKLVDSQGDETGVFKRQIIRHYLHALKLRTTYIFEALPKAVTVWLDFAQQPTRHKDTARRLELILEEIQRQADDIPIYVWYTCITQLLSRITHSHIPSFEVLTKILVKLITSYPEHSLWYVLSHVKSKDAKRRDRIKKALTIAQTEANLGAHINSAQELFEILEGLAAHKVKKNIKKRWTLSGDFNFKETLKPYDALVIPVKSNLEIRLPVIHPYKDPSRKSSFRWTAFPKVASVTFDGFDEEVRIFSSLQMPKQITIRGTDNKPYRLMVKRDDTRKDAKVFEFTNMINNLLSKAAEARKRNLVIENYSVIPLAEDMGIIEFVPEVATMKSVIQLQQKKQGMVLNERSIFLKLDEAQKIVKAKSTSGQEAKDALVQVFNKICKEAQPVLHKWYIDQFSDPAVWYVARKTFTRTSAVMSIVGYVIGLGDRHCENILFFKKSGAALHIDFDCLFDKGETLPTPEIVPFRLTQNMIDAMGITGIEGIFRNTCEVTESLVRDNEASLMNILETLLYDPLLDWRTQEKPQEHLKKVRDKIRGLLDDKSLPMNVHGQVDVLIQKATSEQNLSQMYAGWAPYL